MKEKPTRGFLDYVDITIGRVSDSDSSNPGKRKRSWGATVMLFCMIPAFTLVFAVAFNIVVASLTIKKAVKAETTSTSKVKTRRPSRSVAKTAISFPRPISIEWPIVALASLILLVGVSFSLFRRKQDLERAIQLGQMVADVSHGTKTFSEALPSSVKSMYDSAKSKIGSELTPETPKDDGH